MSGPIYTRRGDQGETSLVGGERVSKSGARVEAYGTVDEANSAIGLVRASLQVASEDEANIDRMLDFVQHRLFNCSSRLATPPSAESESTPVVSAEDVKRLERYIDSLMAAAGDFTGFVLPGGSEDAARMHYARAVVRRAERRIADLASAEPVDPDLFAFVNRLSDLMFAAARYANKVYQGGDVYWNPAL